MSGFEVAAPQRKKVAGETCLQCGSTGVDPAHLWPRSKGGCDDPLCVVPLCRDCHRKFDHRELDILARLISRRYFAELAHVIEAHRVGPRELLARTTGERDADPMEIVKPLLSGVKQHRNATESRVRMLASAAGKPDSWPDNVLGQDKLLYELAQETEEELAVAGFLDRRP